MSPKKSAESGFFNKRKLIAAGAGLALALGLTACSAEGGNKAPSPTETSTSLPTPASTETAPTPTPTTPETPDYRLSDERKTQLESYAKLNFEEFDKLDKKEQLEYFNYRRFVKNVDTLDTILFPKFTKEWYEFTNKPGDKYPEEISQYNTPEEIMTIDYYNFRYLWTMDPNERLNAAVAILPDGLSNQRMFNFLRELHEGLPEAIPYANLLSYKGWGGDENESLVSAKELVQEGDVIYRDLLLRNNLNNGSESWIRFHYIESIDPKTGTKIGNWFGNGPIK